jgi:hypothetical protein
MLSPRLRTASSARLRQALTVWLLAATTLGRTAGAQSTSGKSTQTPDKSAPKSERAQLEEKARIADSLHRTEEAFLLHSRLQNGDFEVGDRISMTYDGFLRASDSLIVVQAGRILPLPEPMGYLNLTGMLRSELTDSLSARVNKYFRNVTVHVSVLLRLLVSGQVRLAGIHYVRTDLPLNDLIARGGLDPSADLANIEIHRGTQVIWGKADVQAAFADGLTPDGFKLEPGDEIVVGAKVRPIWMQAVGLASAAATLLFTFFRYVLPSLRHKP